MRKRESRRNNDGGGDGSGFHFTFQVCVSWCVARSIRRITRVYEFLQSIGGPQHRGMPNVAAATAAAAAAVSLNRFTFAIESHTFRQRLALSLNSFERLSTIFHLCHCVYDDRTQIERTNARKISVDKKDTRHTMGNFNALSMYSAYTRFCHSKYQNF